jgi:ribosomal protein S18 acetylase RimI-like enzyme
MAIVEIEIRKAAPSDAPIIHCLVQTAFAGYRGVINPPTEAENETLEAVTADVEASAAFVAWRDGEAVGTARYELRPDCLYARRVAVPPEYSGQGIADALMLHLEEMARSLGLNRVCLGTRRSLPRNISFYRRLGYRITREEPHHSGPDWTVWFEKDLNL